VMPSNCYVPSGKRPKNSDSGTCDSFGSALSKKPSVRPC